MIISRINLYLSFLIISFTLSAQENSKSSFIIHFDQNKYIIDFSHERNLSQLNSLDSTLHSLGDLSVLDSITVIASSSPDGVLKKNKQLSIQRSNSIVDFLYNRYPDYKNIPISIYYPPILWEKVLQQSLTDTKLPFKEEVLSILKDRTLPSLQKQKRLKALHNGVPYNYIANYYLTELRYAICEFYFKVSPSSLVKVKLTVPENPLPTVEMEEYPVQVHQQPAKWRITTNLLYWAALAHNGGVEYAINNRCYLSLNGACAWWSKRDDYKVYRWLVGELAFTYCIKPRFGQDGPQAGVYVQTGEFEFMNGYKNRKGEFTSAGLSGGYRWKLNKRLYLNAEIGIGYMYIDYRHAIPIESTLIYQGHNYSHYFGPTKAAVSLIFSFNGIKKGK